MQIFLARARQTGFGISILATIIALSGCDTETAFETSRSTLAATVISETSDGFDVTASPIDNRAAWHFSVQRAEPSSDNSLEFEWDFGDGATARGANATHAFPAAGSYLVTVRALADDGQVAFTLSQLVEITGAGGDGGSTPPGPVADAGHDLVAVANQLVFLDGSGSFDSGDRELTYHWTQTAGSDVLLDDADKVVASFVTPASGEGAQLVFELEVDNGARADRDTVTVSVIGASNGDAALDPCRFAVVPEDAAPPVGDIEGLSPLTVTATAFTVGGDALTEGTLSWLIDGASDSAAAETNSVKTLSFTTGGVHTIALALTVGSVTIGCQSARTGATAEQMIVWPMISGRVEDISGLGLAGVVVAANAGGTTDVTDGTGAFVIRVPYNWSGTVTPQHVAYDFSPPSRSWTAVTADVADQPFVAQARSQPCTRNAECDDGLFCNGSESCVGGACLAGSDPCAGQLCNEAADTCGGCLSDAECDDANPCTDDACGAGGICVNTPDDANSCDDGLFCTGTESCVSGSCVSGGDPCPGQTCVEATDTCATGYPISGTASDHAGAAAAGVTISFTGTGSSAGVDFVVTSDAAGGFQQVVPEGWSGTVTSDADYRLEPVSRTYTDVTGAVAGADFTAFRNYYIDSPGDGVGLDGSDSNAGTLQAPFATIQRAANLVNPGDTVYVKAGTYREWVQITRSGTAANRITFRDFQSDVVTIDAEGIRDGGIRVGYPDNYTSGHYVTVDGFRITGTKNGGSGGGAVMYHTQNSTFRNLTVFHCGFGAPIITGALATGIALRGACQNCTVEYCEVYDNYRGGITVSTAGGKAPGSPRNVTVDHCYVHNNENGDDEDSDGIWVYADVNGDSNIAVTNCIVHDNADDGIDAPSSNGVLIAYNIAFEQGRNTTEGDGNGIKVSTSVGGAPNGGGNHLIHHNIVFSNARGGIDQDISPDAPHNFFYHNTVYGNDGHGLILDVGGGANLDTAAVVLNNILVNNNRSGGSFLDYRAGSGGCGGSQANVILDSNFNFVGDGCLHPDEGSGTLTGDPMLADPDALVDTTPQGSLPATMDFIRAQVNAHFALKAGSPGIDAGIDVNRNFPAFDDPATNNTGNAGTGSLDYFDIGAVEFGLSP